MLTFIKLKIFSVGLILIFSQCSLNKNPESVKIHKSGLIEIDVLEALKNKKEFPISKIIKEVEFVQLESIASSFFNHFTSLEITDNYILVACQIQKKVLLFKRTGEFLRQIGRSGRGPGEYLYPDFATIDPSERFIIINDRLIGSLFKFDVNGNLLNQTNINKMFPSHSNTQPIFLDENHFAMSFNRPRTPSEEFYNIGIFNLELELVDKMLPKQNNENLCLPYLFGQKLMQGNNEVLFWESFVDTLYEMKIGDEFKPKYYFEMNGTGLSLSFLKGEDMLSKGTDFNLILDIADLSDYLLFSLFDNGLFQIVYDKKKMEAFTFSNMDNCISKSVINYEAPIWTNDIFGLSKLLMNAYFPKQNLIAAPIYVDRINATDLQCLRRAKVKFPFKRDQLTNLIENFTGEELPIIALLYLK